MTQNISPQILADGLTFTEGPRWHEGRLWFSDFFSHRVLAVDETGQLETILQLDDSPSGLGWNSAGELMVVAMQSQKLLKRVGGSLQEVASLAPPAVGRCNDMVVDASGGAYIGNFGFDLYTGEDPKNTCLVRVAPDGQVSVAAEDLAFPNGMVISPEGDRLIVAETRGQCLTVFDIGSGGDLSNRRVSAQMDGVFPDGICLDAKNGVWVADARGNRVLRVEEGGKVTHEISTGDQGCYACMLGGADGRTLFLCTSISSNPQDADKKKGRIETVRVDVPRAGLP